jgi:hypothetical protein
MTTVIFAGFSRLNGELKFRTANDVKRIDQLRKLGDTDVVILALPNEMTKNDAARFVLTNLAVSYPDFNSVEATALLEGLIQDKNPSAKPQAVKKPRNTVKVTVPNKVKLTGARVKTEPVTEYTPKEAARIRAEFMKQLKAAYEAN